MSRIKFQTDEWGRDKADRLEVHYGDVVIFITITAEGIDILGQCLIDVTIDASNHATIKPVISEELKAQLTQYKAAMR